MCKCCQSCLETLYWHLIEKRFCYDESIALYEEPPPVEKEKNNNMFDNMAFYDSVAVIAGRSIVTIDPLPPKKTAPSPPIVKQPTKTKIKWETEEDLENKVNEEKTLQMIKPLPSITILEEILDGKPMLAEENIKTIEANKETDVDAKKEIKEDQLIRVISEEKNLIKNEVSTISNEEKQSTKTFNTEQSQSEGNINNLLKPVEPVKMRKKSLKERRMSKCASLNLNFDHRLEIPVIRQSSMPRFYLDTPDEHQQESSIVRSPSTALSSPVKPNLGEFSYDLKSIVEIENERRSLNSLRNLAFHKDNSSSTSLARLVHIKDKFSKIKRHASTNNLPNSVNHI